MRTNYQNQKIDLNKIIELLIIMITASFYLLINYTIGSIIIFIMAFIVFVLHGKGFQKINALQLFVLSFGIYGYLTHFWAFDASYAKTRGITIIEMFFLVILLFPCLSDRFTIDELFSFQKWSGYLVVIGAYITYGITPIISTVISGGRLPASFLNPNTLGLVASTSIIIGVYEILSQKISLFDVLLCIPCLILVAASGSRKAIVALVLGCAFIFYYLNKDGNLSGKFGRVFLSVICIMTALYIISSLNIFSGVNQRMQLLINMLTNSGPVDHSALVRQRLIEIGIDQFRKTPIFGIGLDNTRFLSRLYVHEDYYLHNNYVELLAGCGILGFTLYYLMYVYLLFNMILYRKYKSNSYYLVLVLVIIRLVMDYGAVSYYSKETYMDLMIFYSMMYDLKYKSLNKAKII